MEALTARRVRADNHAASVPRTVTYLGAAAFVIAAAWFWLAVKGVTVTAAPRTAPGVGPQQALRIYYRWQVTTLPQERYYTTVAIAGFGCLAVAAAFLRDLAGLDRRLARIGALAVAAGALLWVTGRVLVLGGHRAVGLMATHTNPIQTTNSIAFTIDTTGAAFALTAFALVGAGMFAFATAARHPGHRAWALSTAVIAVAMVGTAASYAGGNGDLSDVMLLISGAVLLPGWLIWTGRLGPADPASADPLTEQP